MMGTSLLKPSPKLQSMAAASFGGFQMPGIWIGTWVEMAGNYSWGYIHRQVLEHIRDRNGLQIEVGIGAGKRVDLYDPRNNEIWEVKPISYCLDPEKHAICEAQIKRYVGDGSIYKRGSAGTITSPMEFQSKEGAYTIYYVDNGDGFVYYSYKKNKPDPSEVTVTEKDKDKFKAKLTEKEAEDAIAIKNFATDNNIQFIDADPKILQYGKVQAVGEIVTGIVGLAIIYGDNIFGVIGDEYIATAGFALMVGDGLTYLFEDDKWHLKKREKNDDTEGDIRL